MFSPRLGILKFERGCKRLMMDAPKQFPSNCFGNPWPNDFLVPNLRIGNVFCLRISDSLRVGKPSIYIKDTH